MPSQGPWIEEVVDGEPSTAQSSRDGQQNDTASSPEWTGTASGNDGPAAAATTEAALGVAVKMEVKEEITDCEEPEAEISSEEAVQELALEARRIPKGSIATVGVKTETKKSDLILTGNLPETWDHVVRQAVREHHYKGGPIIYEKLCQDFAKEKRAQDDHLQRVMESAAIKSSLQLATTRAQYFQADKQLDKLSRTLPSSSSHIKVEEKLIEDVPAEERRESVPDDQIVERKSSKPVEFDISI